MILDVNQTDKWGKFAIISTEGWKISNQFIDYESKLLIVEETPIEKNNVIIKNGVRYVPQNTYVIDCQERKILEPEDWRKRFDYILKEYLIEGTDLKIITKRTSHENANIDSIESKLINTKENRIINHSRSLAFSPKKRKNLYESYLEGLEKRKTLANTSRAQYSLEYQYHRDYSHLQSGDVLLMYRDKNDNAFKVVFNNDKKVVLLKGKEKIPRDYIDRSAITYIQEKSYDSPDSFWHNFTKDQLWFQNLSPYFDENTRQPNNNLFAYHIIHQGNKIRYSSDINWEKYTAIVSWENCFKLSPLLAKELIQVCPNCMSRVKFYPRYPTSVCNQCAHKITDKQGEKVYYVFDPKTQRYKGRYNEHKAYASRICYIEGREYFITEARMSGMVIQLLSAKDYMI